MMDSLAGDPITSHHRQVEEKNKELVEREKDIVGKNQRKKRHGGKMKDKQRHGGKKQGKQRHGAKFHIFYRSCQNMVVLDI